MLEAPSKVQLPNSDSVMVRTNFRHVQCDFFSSVFSYSSPQFSCLEFPLHNLAIPELLENQLPNPPLSPRGVWGAFLYCLCNRTHLYLTLRWAQVLRDCVLLPQKWVGTSISEFLLYGTALIMQKGFQRNVCLHFCVSLTLCLRWPDHDPPICVGMTGLCHCTQTLVEMGSSELFTWPWIAILTISAYGVARIMCVSHHTWPPGSVLFKVSPVTLHVTKLLLSNNSSLVLLHSWSNLVILSLT
jgi:hypothetical protein